MTSPSSFTFKSNFTKGGVAKRIFKPTIPTSRKISSNDNSGQKNSSKECSKKRNRDKNDTKSPLNRPKKEYIQLEGTFNGIQQASIILPTKSEFTSKRNVGEGNLFNNHSSIKVSSDKIKTENINDAIEDLGPSIDDIGKYLYCDDFITYSDNEASGLPPQGWENVIRSRNTSKTAKDSNKSVKSACLNEWFKEGEENLVLFQLPELLLNKNQGKLGKLRVYKSGRIELLDTQTGLKYDVSRAANSVLDQPNLKIARKESIPSFTRKVVSFDENNLICLGNTTENDTLIVLPRIAHLFASNQNDSSKD